MSHSIKKLNEISSIIQKQWEIIVDLSKNKDISKWLERQRLVKLLYEEVFGKDKKDQITDFALQNKNWKQKYGEVEVSIESPDFKLENEDFLEVAPLNLKCHLHTDKEDYTLIVPLHRHNIELYLYGILTTNKESTILSFLDTCLIARPFNLSTSYKWMTKEEDFFRSIYPEDYGWANQLKEACLSAFEDLNILHLQQRIFSGQFSFSIRDLELLKIWSYFYVHCYEQQVNTNKDTSFFAFENFYQWASLTGYTNELHLHLIQEAEGFTPHNCIWSTEKRKFDSGMSKKVKEGISTETLVEIDDTTLTVEDWSAETGLPIEVIKVRMEYNWTGSDLLLPIREKSIVQSKYTHQLYTINGEQKTLKEWSKLSGISVGTLISRILTGWDVEDLLSRKYKKGK